MKNLRKRFYNAASPECSTKSSLYKPPVAFEIKNRLQGIATYYRYPRHMTASEFETYRGYTSLSFQCYENPHVSDFKLVQIKEPEPALMDRMRKEWDGLIALNPWLSKIEFDRNNPLSLHHAIEGVACHFRAEDIQFFITNCEQSRRWDIVNIIMEDPQYKKRAEQIDALSNSGTGWFMSPDTQIRALEKLQQKQKRLYPSHAM